MTFQSKSGITSHSWLLAIRSHIHSHSARRFAPQRRIPFHCHHWPSCRWTCRDFSTGHVRSGG